MWCVFFLQSECFRCWERSSEDGTWIGAVFCSGEWGTGQKLSLNNWFLWVKPVSLFVDAALGLGFNQERGERRKRSHLPLWRAAWLSHLVVCVFLWAPGAFIGPRGAKQTPVILSCVSQLRLNVQEWLHNSFAQHMIMYAVYTYTTAGFLPLLSTA